MTVGRNDPCPCGSGRKYKKCCLPRQEVISLQAVRAERNHEALLDRLLDFAANLPPHEGMADGLIRYFGGPPPEEPTEEDFAEPLDWVIFGYRSPATGTTLCERMVREGRGLTEQEREMAQVWAAGAIPGFFHVISAEPGEIHLRRIWDATLAYVVTDTWEGLHTGDLVAAWLLPAPSGLRFGYDHTHLPLEAGRPLEHLLREELTFLRRQRPEATWDDLYRECWPRLIDTATMASIGGEGCLRIRVPGRPQVQGLPQSHPMWTAVAERFEQVMQAADARPEEVAGGLRLWWDAVNQLQPRVHRVEPWVGALFYLLANRVYGSGETLAEVASMVGSTASSVGSRARDLRKALDVDQADPRYADLLDPYIRALWRVELLAAADAPAPRELPWAPTPSLAEALAGEGYEDTPQGRAEALVDQAWESQGKKRVKLAQQALELWPDAADAYVVLGNTAAERGDMAEAIRLFQAGVEAGERTLGARFFEENVGHFWGLVESRPYMRARFGLAQALWDHGEHEAAIAHDQALLRLNPNDHQGIRWASAARLVALGDDQRLERLLEEHGDDGTAFMLFTRALLTYRQEGPGREANSRLREACEANPHVPAYLLGRRPLPKEPPRYIGFGDEQEAEAYVFDFGEGWAATPGALQWLASRT